MNEITYICLDCGQKFSTPKHKQYNRYQRDVENNFVYDADGKPIVIGTADAEVCPNCESINWEVDENTDENKEMVTD